MEYTEPQSRRSNPTTLNDGLPTDEDQKNQDRSTDHGCICNFHQIYTAAILNLDISNSCTLVCITQSGSHRMTASRSSPYSILQYNQHSEHTQPHHLNYSPIKPRHHHTHQPGKSEPAMNDSIGLRARASHACQEFVTVRSVGTVSGFLMGRSGSSLVSLLV